MPKGFSSRRNKYSDLFLPNQCILFNPILIEIKPKCANMQLGYATINFQVSTVGEKWTFDDSIRKYTISIWEKNIVLSQY